MRNRTLWYLFVSALLSLSITTSAEAAPEAGPLNSLSRDDPFANIGRFFGSREPTAVVMFRGPQIPSEEPDYALTFPIAATPRLAELCDANFIDYFAVAFSAMPDGVQMLRLSTQAHECIRADLEKNRQSVGTEIYSVGISDADRCWNNDLKRASEKMFVGLQKDVLTSATSRSFLTSTINSKPNLDSIADPAFFLTAQNQSLSIIRLFESNAAYTSPALPKKIRSVSFHRTGALNASPFELQVITRVDKPHGAQLLLDEFTGPRQPQGSLRRDGPCNYAVTIKTDSTRFYGNLKMLLTLGFD